MSPSTAPAAVLLRFLGDLGHLVRTRSDDSQEVAYPLCRRASIKDIIEGLGVPHTEVGRIVADGRERTFTMIPVGGERLTIHPQTPDLPPTTATVLRPEPLGALLFLVDINVGRLAGLLRQVGCDAEMVRPGSADRETVLRAVGEGRVLLTRNRELLKHRLLVFGRLLRNEQPEEQLAEIIDLYRLRDHLSPFGRCIACNGLLVEVDKQAILDQLLPLTKKYYHQFKRCSRCARIYWPGSHHQRMTELLHRLLGGR